MIIYADELFLKNSIMSFLILSIVKEIISLNSKKIDLLIGSILASFITVIAIIYEINNSIITRFITIFTMIIIAFKPKEIKTFIIETGFVFAITFLIGGVMNSNIDNLYEIIVCGIISVLAINKYNDYYKKKKWKIRNKYKLEFEIENKKIELNAFLDTGNFLTTNLKNEPVIVVSKRAIIDKVSEEIINLLENVEVASLSFNILKNIRLINYSVLNEENKITYGLKIKNIKVKLENNTIIRDAVIVLSKNNMKDSDAIFGIGLLEGGLENGNIIDNETKSKKIIC